LKCCLNYELDTYLDALQHFPDNCDVIQVAKGNAFLIKKDIFKNLMWYTLPDSNKQYPLSIERVRTIKSLNQQGITPDNLEPVEVVSSKPKDEEPEFVELVGQISLRSLDKAADKKRRQNQPGNQQKGQRPQQRQQGGGQQNQQRNQGGQQQGGQQGQQGQGGQQQRTQRNQGNQQRPNLPDRQAGNPNRNQQRPNNPNRNQGNQQKPTPPDRQSGNQNPGKDKKE
jgi:hypothetical protein